METVQALTIGQEVRVPRVRMSPEGGALFGRGWMDGGRGKSRPQLSSSKRLPLDSDSRRGIFRSMQEIHNLTKKRVS